MRLHGEYFSFSAPLPLTVPRATFISFLVSQLPLLVKKWYIKIYLLSTLLLSFAMLYVFTNIHQPPFNIFIRLQRPLLILLKPTLSFYFRKKNLFKLLPNKDTVGILVKLSSIAKYFINLQFVSLFVSWTVSPLVNILSENHQDWIISSHCDIVFRVHKKVIKYFSDSDI